MTNSILILLLILPGFFVGYTERMKRIEAENSKAAAVSQASNDAFGDCRRIMISDRIVQRANGCVAGIENVCARTNNIGYCLERLKDACNQTYEQ